MTADTIYYVSTQGSDSNDCSQPNPCHIPQYVIGIVQNLDLAGYNVTIQMSDGTYTDPIIFGNAFLTPGNGTVTLRGNPTTPSNVLLQTSGTALMVGAGVNLTLDGVKVSTTNSGDGIYVMNKGNLTINAIEFGPCPGGFHMHVDTGGAIYLNNSYVISGGANVHIFAGFQGRIIYNGPPTIAITFSGNPHFVDQFIFCYELAMVYIYPVSFSGSMTDMAKYYVSMNGVIDTNGSGANYLPGATAGWSEHGGQYI